MNLVFFRKVSRIGVLVRVAGDAAGPVGVRSPVAIDLQQSQAAAAGRVAAERHLRHQPGARHRASRGAPPTTSTTSARAASSASRPASRSTARSIPTSARSRATRSRSRSTSASRCSSRRSGRSSWKAWACSTSPAPAATATCAPPFTPAASSIRFTASKLTGTIGKTTFGVLNAVDDSPTPPFGDRGRAVRRARTRCSRSAARPMGCGAPITSAASSRTRRTTAGTTSSPAATSRAAVGGALVVGDVPDVAHQRRRRADTQRQRRAGRPTTTRRGAGSAPYQVEHYDRDFRDGHGVLQPHRLHRRVDVQRGELLSEASELLAAADSARSVSRSTAATGFRTATRTSSTPASASTSRARASSISRTAAATNRGRARSTRSATTQRLRQHAGAALAEPVGGNSAAGPAIFYDDVDPFQGRGRLFGFGRRSSRTSTCRRTSRATRRALDAPVDRRRMSTTSTSSTRGRRISSTSISWCGCWRSTTAREHRVLTDFLASYEFVPGTVFHAGYGSLYERGPRDGFANDAQLAGASRRALSSDQSRIILQGFIPAEVLRLMATASDDNFDWVSAQAGCSAAQMFQKLQDGAKADVDRRNFADIGPHR